MTKANQHRRVPYDKDGNLMHYPERKVDWANPFTPPGASRPQFPIVEPQLLDAITFTDTLTYEGFTRGHSAAYFQVKDSAGHTYPMFLADMDLVMRTIGVKDGRIPEATWEPCKRGKNYGLRLVEQATR